MVINNRVESKIIHNVIGVLEGVVEKDRYVIVGNHRDSWAFGAMDAASGGVSMLESARILGQHHKKTQWRPRRSIVFASWSGEEQGLIGSYEWVEEVRHLLTNQAVAYLNVDTCVSGPVFHPDASPSLMQAVRDAAKRVPSHLVEGDKDSNKNITLYDALVRAQNGTEPPR